jgi:hypothetical protein
LIFQYRQIVAMAADGAKRAGAAIRDSITTWI